MLPHLLLSQFIICDVFFNPKSLYYTAWFNKLNDDVVMQVQFWWQKPNKNNSDLSNQVTKQTQMGFNSLQGH